MAYSILPRPKRSQTENRQFTFDTLRIFTVGNGAAFARTLKALMPRIKTEAADREHANVILSVAPVFSCKNEYCALRILPDRMEIRCHDEMGARNAACLLAQIIEDNRIPCGSIEDWPDASYRSFMLESSGRSWLSMERIYLYIRQMALARMNDLQFHFMEAPGCTIELDCYPDMHGFGPDNLKYTKDEIRAMVAYAAELGITVTPFVEVISHSFVFNKAADIACPGDRDENMFAVCVGQEKTFEAIEKVLTEVADLFPAPILHIGGDEYDMSEVTPRTVHWGQCPHCQALSEKMGFTTYRELFIYAVERVNQIVNKLEKISMLWNADLKPGELPEELERNIIIHYYRCDNPLCKEKIFGLSLDGYVEEGFTVVNSSYKQTYLDKYISSERMSSWGYDSDPRVSPENQAGVLGGCCCAWEDHRHFERTISPAIFLFADRLWHSFGKPTVYDDAFGRLLTQRMFDGLLPTDMNVFNAVGDILPPVNPRDVLFYERNLIAPIAELERIHTALSSLEHPLAAPYSEIAAAALAYQKAKTDTLKTTSEEFDG
ncbi:MAG: family 20 glycosylhydrolase [Clostridia bacterium]|nr:family 20 glycosylhydrolase [Clostridia bacterium]